MPPKKNEKTDQHAHGHSHGIEGEQHEHLAHGSNESDPDFEEEIENFTNNKSSSSCHVDDIQGILFGGTSSRFWMFRKHINSMTIQ